MARFPQHHPASEAESRAAAAVRQAVGDFALLRVTQTGLAKGIIDANRGIRDYFREQKFHDYEGQEQGDDGRVLKPAALVDATGRRATLVSLYRPKTKKGDPRIWIRGLPELVAPFDLLALTVMDGELVVVNLSAIEVVEPSPTPAGAKGEQLPLEVGEPRAGELPPDIKRVLVADPLEEPDIAEALRKLRIVAGMGWIDGDGTGDTAVGRTLETALGIPMNSKEAPDLHGCELKSFRTPRNRVSLFSKVPDWSRSALPNSREVVKAYGKPGASGLQIRHTVKSVTTSKFNSFGLGLWVDDEDDDLWLIHESAPKSPLVIWDLETLREKLAQKHRTTFWLRADTRKAGSAVQFRYAAAQLTQRPKVELLAALIEQGVIQLDLRLTIRTSGKGGDVYLFKLAPANFDLLFPVREVDLFA